MKKADNFKFFIFGLVAIAIILFLSISTKLRAAIFVSIFIVLNMLISNYKKYIKLPIEIEFLTLGIVLCTVRYGIKAGLVVAILGGILGFIVGFNISPFSFPMMAGYILMALVSYLGRNLPITLLGIIVTIANNSLVFIVYHFLFGYDITKNLSFGITNILLNLILFMKLL